MVGLEVGSEVGAGAWVLGHGRSDFGDQFQTKKKRTGGVPEMYRGVPVSYFTTIKCVPESSIDAGTLRGTP